MIVLSMSISLTEEVNQGVDITRYILVDYSLGIIQYIYTDILKLINI